MEINKDKNILILIFGVFLVFCFYFFFKLLYFKLWFSSVAFSRVINPIEVIGILVTLSTAFILGYLITKKVTEQRFLKGILINDIFRIEEEINSFERIVSNSDKLEIKTVFDTMQTLKNKLIRFEKTATLNEFSSDKFKYLNSCHIKLYQTVTTTDSEEIIIENCKDEIDSLCSEIIITLREIISLINKK